MEYEIIKLSTDWAKAEVFSAKMVWLFSAMFILVAIGFWYLGKTAMAKAFIVPVFIAGLFLAAIGAGLYFANHPRINKFEQSCRQNPEDFKKQEIERTAESQKQLAAVFKILPFVVIVGAIVVFLLPGSVNARAIGITLLITSSFLMAVDSNTDARNTDYHTKLDNLKTFRK